MLVAAVGVVPEVREGSFLVLVKRRTQQVILELISIVAPPHRHEELGHALGSFVGPTQVEPGCLGAAVFQDQRDSCRLRFESRWESLDHLAEHIQSDSYKKLLHLMELSENPPGIEFLTVSSSEGIELIRSARREQRLRPSAKLRRRNLRSA